MNWQTFRWRMFFVVKCLLFLMTVLCSLVIGAFINERVWIGVLAFTCFTIYAGNIFLVSLTYKKTDMD